MRYNPDTHHRRSIRLKGYDYSQVAAYFVTICVQEREDLFGKIASDEMQLNNAGRMVQSAWKDLPRYYPGAEIDAFVVMPNHIHGIVVLTDPVGAAAGGRPDPEPAQAPESGQASFSAALRGLSQGPDPTNPAPVGATPCGRPCGRPRLPL